MEVGRESVQRKRTVCDQGKTLVSGWWLHGKLSLVKSVGDTLVHFIRGPREKSSDGFFDLLISPLEGRGCKVQKPASMSAISMSFLAMGNQQPAFVSSYVLHPC